MDLEELKENFELLDNWEDKYSYIIDMGKSLEPMEESFKTPETKVEGCTSQVWLVEANDSTDESFKFIADSDSAIVKGLIAVLHAIYDGRNRAEIKDLDIETIFNELGLQQHISVNRRNGFFSMVQRIKG